MTLPLQSPQQQVESYLAEQANLDTLRFITCGSVDDGKSTLIGRMLYEAQLIFDDQVTHLQRESKKRGTQGGDIDFALLVDGLAAEREQGITIDVAYRFFATDRRKFIVADTPGHEQYTRNMVTGASTADAAIILVDARLGVLTQTKRHSFICATVGIKNVVLAINKMDLVDYEESIARTIEDEYRTFAERFEFSNITMIPISALKGDNIVKRSSSMDWYDGPTLLAFLETIVPPASRSEMPLRFPVQWVNRPNLDFRGVSGTIEAGQIVKNQKVRILPSGEEVDIQDIILFKDNLERAENGQSVTLTFNRQVDASRGDVIVGVDSPCEIADQFEAQLVWLDRDPGFVGRSYWLKLGTTVVGAQISNIKYAININTFEHVSSSKLTLNDICVVTLTLSRPIPFDPFITCESMGAFILIDRLTNNTIAAGTISFSLRRSQNTHYQKLDINKGARRRLNGHTSKVLWFTGLSGSGKSTIANALEKRLHAQGIRTFLLDGDNVRHGLNNDLGFTDADRIENIRRVGEVTKLMVDAGIVVLTAFISPFRAERRMVRQLFDKNEFIEIFVDTPLDLAEERDPKGLYKKARKGKIPNFTGINSPYEIPKNPEFCLNTADSTVDELVDFLLESMDFSN